MPQSNRWREDTNRPNPGQLRILENRISSSTCPQWHSLLTNLCNLHPTLVLPSLHHLAPQIQLSRLPFFSPALPLLSLTSPSHLSTNYSTFSTSLKPHWAQILSSLSSPIHLPVSSLNSAEPPLNFAISCLSFFLATCTHLALHHLPLDSSTLQLWPSLSFHHPCFLHLTPCTVPRHIVRIYIISSTYIRHAHIRTYLYV